MPNTPSSTPESGKPFTARQASPQNPIVMLSCAGGHSGPPLRRGFVSTKSHIGYVNGCATFTKTNTWQAEQRDARWNEERVGRKPDIPRYGDCKPARIRRLTGRAPYTMAISNNDNHIPKSCHREWSTHLASRRYRLAQPDHTDNSGFVTPGGIGTHGIQPPRKRTRSDSKSQPHGTSVTRGRTQRSAPTQRICFIRSQYQHPPMSFPIARRHRHARDTSTA